MDSGREKLALEVYRMFSKKLFGIITILSLLLSACINTGFHYGIEWLNLNFFTVEGNEVVIKNLPWIVKNIELVSNNFYFWVVPPVTGSFLLFGWLLWFILKSSMSKNLSDIHMQVSKGHSKGKSKKDFVDQKIEQDRKQRLFLHSLSVLQRDGRLLDFFDEDLSLYADDQIGAAVRSIQEDCKKTIKKYIDPKPVMENEEGELVSIEPGFDVDSIKLIGNVAGEPPFNGVLKHRGWRAGKKEVPKLSDIQDAGIIIPAEVEIQ